MIRTFEFETLDAPKVALQIKDGNVVSVKHIGKETEGNSRA